MLKICSYDIRYQALILYIYAAHRNLYACEFLSNFCFQVALFSRVSIIYTLIEQYSPFVTEWGLFLSLENWAQDCLEATELALK